MKANGCKDMTLGGTTSSLLTRTLEVTLHHCWLTPLVVAQFGSATSPLQMRMETQ